MTGSDDSDEADESTVILQSARSTNEVTPSSREGARSSLATGMVALIDLLEHAQTSSPTLTRISRCQLGHPAGTYATRRACTPRSRWPPFRACVPPRGR
jgi:hypothetical protein